MSGPAFEPEAILMVLEPEGFRLAFMAGLTAVIRRRVVGPTGYAAGGHAG
jgi:hypothetical protein